MSDSPRWERESQEDLRLPAHPLEETTEFDAATAAATPADELDALDTRAIDQEDDGGSAPPWAPRLRESLAAARASTRESLGATRQSTRESLAATRGSISDTAGRVGRWVAALDRRPEFDHQAARDPIAELGPGMLEPDGIPPLFPGDRDPDGVATATAGAPDPADDGAAVRFPIAPLGYNRHAVDRYVAELEAELERLRADAAPPMSITEEIERLGEQTASILVTAHDKAHETARAAQRRAADTVSEAQRNAERMIDDAQRRLRTLDEETDAVWRERERLLQDVRTISASLGVLADDALERFPAAPEPAAPTAAAEPAMVAPSPE